jgi:hypothetical protein
MVVVVLGCMSIRNDGVRATDMRSFVPPHNLNLGAEHIDQI